MSRHKILIIEDEPRFVDWLRDRLTAYDLCIATNAKAGFEQFDTFKPDLIIIDIQLDGMNTGINLGMEIRLRSQVPCFT